MLSQKEAIPMHAARVTVTLTPIQAELLQCYAEQHHAGDLGAATRALAVAGLRDQLARDDALCDAWDAHRAGVIRAVQSWDDWGSGLMDSTPLTAVSPESQVLCVGQSADPPAE
jgi:hypothetical protein